MPLPAGRGRIVASLLMDVVVLGFDRLFPDNCVGAGARSRSDWSGRGSTTPVRWPGPRPGDEWTSRPAPPRNIGGIASRLVPCRAPPPMTAVSTPTPPAERRPPGCARCRGSATPPHGGRRGGDSRSPPGVGWPAGRSAGHGEPGGPGERGPGSRDQASALFKRGKTAVEQVSSKHRQVAGPAAPFCPSGAARHSARAERQGTLPERSATARCHTGAAPHPLDRSKQHAIRPGTDRWNGIVDVEGRGRERSVDRVCGSHGPPPPRVPARAAD
jgi:hypothetical protein